METMPVHRPLGRALVLRIEPVPCWSQPFGLAIPDAFEALISVLELPLDLVWVFETSGLN
jgi:hypothetical protein